MTYSVSLSPDVYVLLRQRARQSKVSPDTLADDALRRYLHHEEPTWRQSFDVREIPTFGEVIHPGGNTLLSTSYLYRPTLPA